MWQPGVKWGARSCNPFWLKGTLWPLTTFFVHGAIIIVAPICQTSAWHCNEHLLRGSSLVVPGTTRYVVPQSFSSVTLEQCWSIQFNRWIKWSGVAKAMRLAWGMHIIFNKFFFYYGRQHHHSSNDIVSKFISTVTYQFKYPSMNESKLLVFMKISEGSKGHSTKPPLIR